MLPEDEPLAVDNQWKGPQLAEATLLTFKTPLPMVRPRRMRRRFYRVVRKDNKTSKNADEAFLTFAKRWVY